MSPDPHAYGTLTAAIGATSFWLFIAICVVAGAVGSACWRPSPSSRSVDPCQINLRRENACGIPSRAAGLT